MSLLKQPAKGGQTHLQTIVITLIALIAFAANSVLCRLALGDGLIDAPSFTVVRLASGALMLLLLVALMSRFSSVVVASKPVHTLKRWLAPLMLFIYALSFSYAYLSLNTGVGALILFAAVQLTLVALALFAGERLSKLEWMGLALAFAGFVYLILPGVSAPSPVGFVLMTVAGVAWGGYTRLGMGSVSPVRDTARNFIISLPLVLVLMVITVLMGGILWSWQGVMWAVLSGALASGLGYSLWYMALKGLSLTQAGVAQLLVPVIATVGGVIFVGDQVTQRLLIATLVILGGIMMVLKGRRRSRVDISSD